MKIRMQKRIFSTGMGTLGVILMLVMLFSACRSYQVGGTLEPRQDTNAYGAFLAGDWFGDNNEWSLAYFPEAYPRPDGGFQFQTGSVNHGFGMDYLFKYPFHFLGNHFSIFPALGFDLRYFQPQTTVGDWYEPDITDYFGMGIKFGGGFDISFSRYFFLRAKALYTPEILSFMESKPGFRFSVGLGYRTDNDTVRSGFKTFQEQKRENVLKKARENFDKKNYSEAVTYYQRAINLGAALGNSGVTNLSTALYEDAKRNQNNGNYREALDSFNESMRRQYFMSRQKYSDWKELLGLYEKTYGRDAPHGGYSKLIFSASDNLTIGYEREQNGQTDFNEIKGTGWNINLPAGQRVFNLAYDEPHYERGYLVSDDTKVTLDMEEGHIYQAKGDVSGSQVIISITDVTNMELGKNFNISSDPVFKRTLTLREERPKEQNISITIVNNTGYSVYFMYISPEYSDRWGSDILNSTEVLRNKKSRRVILPPINIARRYDIRLRDRDGDTYTKWGVTITPNMTITFTILDIDL
jgi:tetratricopeptide (TPR) repeat protein